MPRSSHWLGRPAFHHPHPHPRTHRRRPRGGHRPPDAGNEIRQQDHGVAGRAAAFRLARSARAQYECVPHPVTGIRIALPIVGAILGAVATALGPGWRDVGLWLPDIVTGTALFALAGVALPASRSVAIVLALAGLAWFAGTLWAPAVLWHRAPLLHAGPPWFRDPTFRDPTFRDQTFRDPRCMRTSPAARAPP